MGEGLNSFFSGQGVNKLNRGDSQGKANGPGGAFFLRFIASLAENRLDPDFRDQRIHFMIELHQDFGAQGMEIKRSLQGHSRDLPRKKYRTVNPRGRVI